MCRNLLRGRDQDYASTRGLYQDSSNRRGGSQGSGMSRRRPPSRQRGAPKNASSQASNLARIIPRPPREDRRPPTTLTPMPTLAPAPACDTNLEMQVNDLNMVTPVTENVGVGTEEYFSTAHEPAKLPAQDYQPYPIPGSQWLTQPTNHLVPAYPWESQLPRQNPAAFLIELGVFEVLHRLGDKVKMVRALFRGHDTNVTAIGIIWEGNDERQGTHIDGGLVAKLKRTPRPYRPGQDELKYYANVDLVYPHPGGQIGINKASLSLQVDERMRQDHVIQFSIGLKLQNRLVAEIKNKIGSHTQPQPPGPTPGPGPSASFTSQASSATIPPEADTLPQVWSEGTQVPYLQGHQILNQPQFGLPEADTLPQVWPEGTQVPYLQGHQILNQPLFGLPETIDNNPLAVESSATFGFSRILRTTGEDPLAGHNADDFDQYVLDLY